MLFVAFFVFVVSFVEVSVVDVSVVDVSVVDVSVVDVSGISGGVSKVKLRSIDVELDSSPKTYGTK